MWYTLQMPHERTNQVKKSKINILTHQYKLFNMEEVESIDEMFSRFTVIISDLKSLEKT